MTSSLMHANSIAILPQQSLVEWIVTGLNGSYEIPLASWTMMTNGLVKHEKGTSNTENAFWAQWITKLEAVTPLDKDLIRATQIVQIQ